MAWPAALSVVGKAVLTWFQAANVGTSAYPFLTMANANLLVAHGTPEQVDTWVRPMTEGRFFGTMCLSEPQAGSSLADITTRAVPQDDGTYRLTGNKMWISGGDHDLTENIVHLVLAKIAGGPPGVKGISLFIVPKVLLAARRHPGGAKRRGARRAQPQDGIPRHHEHAAELRGGQAHPGWSIRRGGLPAGRGAPRTGLHVPHDERGAASAWASAPRHWATPGTCTRWTTPRTRTQGRLGRREGPHAARRCR